MQHNRAFLVRRAAPHAAYLAVLAACGSPETGPVLGEQGAALESQTATSEEAPPGSPAWTSCCADGDGDGVIDSCMEATLDPVTGLKVCQAGWFTANCTLLSRPEECDKAIDAPQMDSLTSGEGTNALLSRWMFLDCTCRNGDDCSCPETQYSNSSDQELQLALREAVASKRLYSSAMPKQAELDLLKAVGGGRACDDPRWDTCEMDESWAASDQSVEFCSGACTNAQVTVGPRTTTVTCCMVECCVFGSCLGIMGCFGAATYPN
jgi:hypothetical protein